MKRKHSQKMRLPVIAGIVKAAEKHGFQNIQMVGRKKHWHDCTMKVNSHESLLYNVGHYTHAVRI